MDPIKWLLVGAGDIARKRVAPALAQAEGSNLAAICDSRLEIAQSLAESFGIKRIFSSYEEALSDPVIDAVYLATPVFLHTDQLIKALQAGKHALVEKPLGLDTDECRQAVAEAGQNDKTAGCAYFRRLYPAYQNAKTMLEKGEFGTIILANLLYYSWFDPAPEDPKYWRVKRLKSGGGPLSDIGSHMFDVLIGLFGLPERVYAHCENRLHTWDVEDTATVLMRLSSGAEVTAFFSWCSKTWRHEFEIVGTEAKVDWIPYDSGQVIKTVGRQVESLNFPVAANVHLPLVEDFIDAIRNHRPPACPLREAIKTNYLLDAIYRSSREKCEIQIEG